MCVRRRRRRPGLYKSEAHKDAIIQVTGPTPPPDTPACKTTSGACGVFKKYKNEGGDECEEGEQAGRGSMGLWEGEWEGSSKT